MMRVYVDDREVILHRGMKVKHALTLYQLKALRAGELLVRDCDGNLVGLEGSLIEGSRLYTQGGEPGTADTGSP